MARTDLVAFVPRRLIAALSNPLSLMTVTPPIDPGMDKQFMFYSDPRAGRPRLDLAAQPGAGTGRGLERPKRKAA